MTALIPERVIDRGLATTRWKTHKHGNNDEQKGHDRDEFMLAEPARRRDRSQLQSTIADLTGVPHPRVSVGMLRQAPVGEEIAEPLGDIELIDFPEVEDSPTDAFDLELDDLDQACREVGEYFGLSPQQVRLHRSAIISYLRETGGFIHLGDPVEELRAMSGIPAPGSWLRQSSFLDADDDDHDSLYQLGMRIRTRV